MSDVTGRAAAPATLDVDDAPEALLEAFLEREWADGLPIVPPTPERVAAMLGARDPARSLGAMPPLWREATLEKLAVNAVMAGCRPEYFPLVEAAVEAMLDPTFNLYGVQATTHPVAPLVIAHGPYARAVGVHAGSGCFGPGFRANATIGRAIRLVLLNVGGAWPGRHDMATQGSPAKFSFCIGENEDASPWGPLVPGDAVTVYGGEPPHNVNDHVSTTAAGILATVAHTTPACPSARTSAGISRRASSSSCSDRSTRGRSRATASPVRTCNASSSRTRGCRSGRSSSAACGASRTGRRG
jgi:hypothetical protein